VISLPPETGRPIIAIYGRRAAVNRLAGLTRNQLYQCDDSVLAALNRGDVATGVINHYYWFRLRQELGKPGGAPREAEPAAAGAGHDRTGDCEPNTLGKDQRAAQ
jgi:hypothetical protein